MQGITLELSDEQYAFLERLASRENIDVDGAFRDLVDVTIGRDLLARAFTRLQANAGLCLN